MPSPETQPQARVPIVAVDTGTSDAADAYGESGYGSVMGRTLIAMGLVVALAACSLQVLPVPTGPIAGGPSSSSGGLAGSGGVSASDSGAPADAIASDAADAAGE